LSKDVLIRSAVSSDINRLMALDHHYSTDHVWQMGVRTDHEGVTEVSFRETRLPRVMRVTYPRRADKLADEWVNRLQILVAEVDETLCGYSAVIQAPAQRGIWLTDLVVGLPYRREGVGSNLLRKTLVWSGQEGFTRLFAEVQSKNYPAISLFKKFGFAFSGYCDSFFPDQDIALLFVGECGIQNREEVL
jgi:ribosomal protein S18 acetylase RimI-like enzyme